MSFPIRILEDPRNIRYRKYWDYRLVFKNYPNRRYK
jgi:hypothetical protein